MYLNNIKKLSGDASFRKFYRSKSSVIVFCKKEKKANLLIYDAINKILLKNNILSPKLLSENYKKNYIEIDDFGDLTVFKKLKKKNINKFYYYKKILNLLKKIQRIKNRKIKTFLKSDYKISDYSNRKIINEANLFLKWYLPQHIKGKKKNIVKKKISKIFKKLISQLLCKKKVFIHRDFHISNIMITKKGLGLIDNQDAIFGNISYDLASLIDDVRFKTSIKTKNLIFNEFLKINTSIDKKKFKNDFDILSIMRNLKIIGIFTRLSIRDKKNKYLKLIPYAWKLIETRLSTNNKFSNLKAILDENFDKKMRNIYEN
mgnify:CR=1 FL=1